MYYQEKWIDGKLYVKTTPNGSWKIKQPTLADLRDAIDQGHISITQAIDMAFARGKLFSQDMNADQKLSSSPMGVVDYID